MNQILNFGVPHISFSYGTLSHPISLFCCSHKVAFGTMTNVSRYGNRNEEFRSEYYNKKLPGLERALFKALSPEARNTIKFNPFVKQLQICFDEFVSAAKYYNTKYHAIQEKTGGRVPDPDLRLPRGARFDAQDH